MSSENKLSILEGTLEEIFKKNPLPKLSEAYPFFERAFFLVSNERVDSHFFHALRERYSFDGYIIGCGSSTIWTLPEVFQSVPKGMVIVDVDLRIICFSKLLIQLFKRYADFTTFLQEFRSIQKNGWKLTLESIIAEEEDIALKSLFINWLDRSYLNQWKGDFDWLGICLWEESHDRPAAARSKKICVLPMIRKNYSTLHAMAIEGKIVVQYRDVFDKALLSRVEGLPGYKESTSLLYLSNAIDHEHEKSGFGRGFISSHRFRNHLKKSILTPFYRLCPTSPQKLVTIDTLMSLGYFLRACEGVPLYSFYHFLFSGPMCFLKWFFHKESPNIKGRIRRVRSLS